MKGEELGGLRSVVNVRFQDRHFHRKPYEIAQGCHTRKQDYAGLGDCEIKCWIYSGHHGLLLGRELITDATQNLDSTLRRQNCQDM